MAKIDKNATLQRYGEYAGVAILSIGLALLINPWSYLVYGLILSFFIFLLFFKNRSPWSKKLQTYYYISLASYAFILLLFAISPYLRFEEFKLSHFHWKTTSGFITQSDELSRGLGRSKGLLQYYAYADIAYIYEVTGVTYTGEERTILNTYKNFWEHFDSPDHVIGIVQQRIATAIAQGEYQIMHNPHQPEESKLLIGREPIFIRGTFLLHVFPLLVLLAGFFIYLFRISI